MTRRSLRACCAGGLAALVLSPVASAQFPPPPTSQPAMTRPAASRPDLPEAKTLFERGIASMGGRDALKAIKSSSIVAQMNTPMGNMAMKMYAAAPDKFLINRSMAGMGDMATGFDGAVLWSSDPMGGYQVHDGAGADEMRGQATMYDMLLRLERDTTSMQTIDDAMFQGKACYKVELTDDEGQRQFAYFDTQSGHLAGAEQSQQGPQGPMSSSIGFSDWKKVGPLTMYHKVTVSQGPMMIDMIFSEVSFDGVPAEKFELPEQVKKLAAEQEPATQPTSQPGG